MGKPRTDTSEIRGKNESGLVARGTAAPKRNSGTDRTAGSGFPQKTTFIKRENNPSLLNLSPSDLSPKAPVAENPGEIPAEKTVFAGELFKQIAANLGFPQDFLSITLLAFSRFFSLSPGELMGTLRRELLASGKASSPGAAREKAALEAEALGMVAALDKCVSLSPEALASYARFFMPPLFAGDGDGEKAATTPDGDEEPPPSAEELRAIAEEQAQEDTLLNFLNTLPGKNGQYWTVFPFKIKVRGTELKVFIRILKRELFSAAGGEHLIADIAGPKRQWRCFLEKKAGKFRADIRVYPALSPRNLKSLKKEAERFFGEGAALPGKSGGFEEIVVQNGKEVPSWVEDLCTESLPSINKEV